MPDALNIPKKKNQFEVVPFVEEMTQHQLKVMIKRMWLNIQELATELDDSRPDIAHLLDMLLDGQKINANNIRDGQQYFQINNNLVQYDAKTNRITLIDSDGDIVLENVQGYDYKVIKATIAKHLK
jgi:CTP-dependent riboflavin kinase